MKPKEVKKPWGKYAVLEQTPEHWIKKLYVDQGRQLSLQSHRHRTEIWVVLSGRIRVIKGDQTLILKKGEMVEIAKREKHRIAALASSCVLEVAFGQVSEDDIIRYEDDYGRQNKK